MKTTVLISFLCLDKDHPVFLSSSVCPPGDHCIFSIHVFCGLLQHIGHCLHVVLVDREEELSKLQPIGECNDKNFVVDFVNQEGLLVETGHV